LTRDSQLLIAGWKAVSLVDVHRYSSFTLWTCGCNLKCPFCHNWKIANIDSSICKYISVETILEEILASSSLVTYLHVTGGEPLIQWRGLVELFKKTRGIVLNSLNSNLTLYVPLKRLLELNLVHHVAVDLKVPPVKLYGLPPSSVERLWAMFLKSLALLRQHHVLVELRIPVHRGLTREVLERYLDQVRGLLDPEKTVVIFNQLLGEPIVNPRNREWCRENCFPEEALLVELAEVARSYGFSSVHIKSIPGFPQ
jgi:pyruvate formate lyase activating enzyme